MASGFSHTTRDTPGQPVSVTWFSGFVQPSTPPSQGGSHPQECWPVLPDELPKCGLFAIPFSFPLYLSIPFKLKFTPVRAHFPQHTQKLMWVCLVITEASANAARMSNKQGQLLGALTATPAPHKALRRNSHLKTKLVFLQDQLLGLWSFPRSHKCFCCLHKMWICCFSLKYLSSGVFEY